MHAHSHHHGHRHDDHTDTYTPPTNHVGENDTHCPDNADLADGVEHCEDPTPYADTDDRFDSIDIGEVQARRMLTGLVPGGLLDRVTISIPNGPELQVMEVTESRIGGTFCDGQLTWRWEYGLDAFNEWISDVGATVSNEDTGETIEHEA